MWELQTGYKEGFVGGLGLAPYRICDEISEDTFFIDRLMGLRLRA